MSYNEEYSSAGEHPDYSGGATWFNSTLFFFRRNYIYYNEKELAQEGEQLRCGE